MSEGGLEPPRPLRALAPQASASAIPPPGQGVRGSERRDGPAYSMPRVLPTASATGDRTEPAEVVGKDDDRIGQCRMPRPPAPPTSDGASTSAAEREVVQLCSELIRIESVNTGDPDTIGDGEARAARYIQAQARGGRLRDHLPGGGAGPRATSSAGWPGADPSRGALLVHGHVDVVPANAAEWTVDPFSGAVQDGYVWGRGAVDMKDMVAMTVAVARDFKTHRVRPAAGPDLRVHVRRGGRRQLGVAVAGRPPPGAVHRRHRGDLRGRRLLHPAGRRPPRLPGRRGRKGRRLGDISRPPAGPVTVR